MLHLTVFLWIDHVRTELSFISGLIFYMRVVFIKITRIFSHFVIQVFFLANNQS